MVEKQPPSAQENVPSPGVVEGQKALQLAAQKLQRQSGELQKGLVQRTDIKGRVQDCMQHCEPIKAKAEAITKRTGGDQQKQTGPPIRKAEDFAAQKGWTIRDVLDVSAFEDCLVGCQKPLRTLQMVMQQNLMAISKNQRACMDQCPPMSDRDERFFECALECTNDASEQLALIDKRLNDEILSVEREVFAANTRL